VKQGAPLHPAERGGLSASDVTFPFWDKITKKISAVSIVYC